MIEQTNIETVWLIEDNELKKANKRVEKVNYNGTEIAVLKTEVGSYGQEYLFKDKDNEYWKMNIAGIEFKKFISASIDSTLTESKNYCDRVIEKLSTFDLKEFFTRKIERKNYFNKCELAYISKHFPDMYDMAKNSREEYIEENRRIDQEAFNARKQQERETVKQVNTEFKRQLKEIKQNIYKGETIKIFDFKFYKDNEYKFTPDTQNCVLFLAKEYDIKIPLATQGFINNRLTDYNFKTKKGFFKATSNKRCSQTMFEYLDKIYDSVKKELKKQRVCER